MKITIESTDQITNLDGVIVRVWKGVTEKGTPCFVFVHRIASDPDVIDAEEFAVELQEGMPPGRVVDLLAVLYGNLGKPGHN